MLMLPAMLLILATDPLTASDRERLLDALQDRRADRRLAAVNELGAVEEAGPEVADWLIQRLGDPEPRVARAAHEGLLKLERAAVPALLDSYDCLAELQPRDTESEPVCPVRDVLSEIGPEGVAPAVCARIGLGGGLRPAAAAMEVAGQLGLKACVPQLIEALARPGADASAIMALQALARGDPRLLAALDRPEPRARVAAAQVLLSGSDWERALPELRDRIGRALAEALPRARGDEVLDIVRTLGRLGEAAAPAASALLAAIQTSQPPLAAEAAGALWRTGVTGAALVAAAWPRLGPVVRQALLEGARGVPAAEGLLVSSLGDADPNLRRAAAQGLGSLVASSRRAGQALLRAASDDTDPAVRTAALSSLGSSRTETAETCSFLAGAARGETGAPGHAAIQALGMLCRSRPAARAALVDLARSARPAARGQALGQLALERPSPPELPALLAAALRDPHVRLAAFQALESMEQRPDLSALVPELLSSSEDEWTAVQLASLPGALPALVTAARNGGAPGEAALLALSWSGDIDALLPLLHDPHAGLREAARAGIEEGSRSIFPNQMIEDDALVERLRAALVRSLSDPDPELRVWAAGQVARDEQRPVRVVDLLLPLLADSDENVRKAAGEGLGGYAEHVLVALAAAPQRCPAACRRELPGVLLALESAPALGLLEELARDGSDDVRAAVASALARSRPAHRGLFLRSLRDPARDVRRAAVRALVWGGSLEGLDVRERVELAGLVVAQLDDPDLEQRTWAINAALRLGPAARPALERALRDSLRSSAAREALSRLGPDED